MFATWLDQMIDALSTAQAGAVARRQVLGAGGTDKMLEARLRRSLLVPTNDRGVYLDPAVAPSFRQRLWVARLALPCWAAVSHEAAAALHGFDAYPPGPVTLLVPNGTHVRAHGATVHQTRDPWLVKVEPNDGLLVTTPEYTFITLAATSSSGRIRHSLETAVIVQKTTSYAKVGAELADVARRGKPGVRKLAAILDDLSGDGVRASQSEMERALLALFDRYGGPRPVPQWEYPTRQQVNGCADVGFDDVLLAVEADSRRWHTRIAAAKRDHERDLAAARHGVQVLRVHYEHIKDDPKRTWQAIIETYEARRRQLGGE